MAFIKVKDKKGKEDAIINTDMICRIAKTKSGYIVFFSSGNTGAAYYEYDEAEAKKIRILQSIPRPKPNKMPSVTQLVPEGKILFTELR